MPLGLPPERAFVIQLASECDPHLSAPRGRVEHVSSGRNARFESRDELWSFLGRILSDEESGEKHPYRNEMPR